MKGCSEGWACPQCGRYLRQPANDTRVYCWSWCGNHVWARPKRVYQGGAGGLKLRRTRHRNIAQEMAETAP